MLDILNLKTEAFGLDISDLSLKIVKLKKDKKFFEIASFGETPIAPGIIKKGEIRDEKTLSGIIKEALKKVKGEGLKVKHVGVSLPEEKAYLEVIQLPKMSAEDLKSAVVFEAENYIPLPVDQVYLDYQVITPVRNHLDHLDVLLAALPKTTVDPYLSCLKSAGLEPKFLEIESLAIARALVKNELIPQSVLLIDSGATRTSFIVFSGRSIRFTSSIPVSGINFTEIIAKTMKVSMDEAEKLKIQYGLGEVGPEKEKSEIFEALVPALVDLAQQIKKYLNYYQSHASHEHLAQAADDVSKILLCGGGANLKGLVELLSLELKMPVELGNPWANILPENKSAKGLGFAGGESLRYTTALGLALRGVQSAFL